mgnify:CR=1 FL=1
MLRANLAKVDLSPYCCNRCGKSRMLVWPCHRAGFNFRAHGIGQFLGGQRFHQGVACMGERHSCRSIRKATVKQNAKTLHLRQWKAQTQPFAGGQRGATGMSLPHAFRTFDDAFAGEQRGATGCRSPMLFAPSMTPSPGWHSMVVVKVLSLPF